MVAYVGHVVRRGIEEASKGFQQGNGQQPIELNIPGWGQALFSLTIIFFSVFMMSLEYTLKDVVATLTMVESPSTEISLTTPSEDANPLLKDGNNVEDGPAITLVRQKPITSKIRITLRHLKAQAGKLSMWRGLVPFMFYNVCHHVLTNLLNAVLPRIIPGAVLVYSAISAVLLVRLHAAWTHTVISMPSNKRFWQRMPAPSSWRLLALPAAVKACAGYVSLYVALGFVYILRLDHLDGNKMSAYKGGDWFLLALRVSSLVAVVLLCALFIILPATVTLVRVEASLLPEEDETIVPFDRSFGGKVVPSILGGTGAIGFVDAWRSFNWEARRRLVKLYVKVSAIMFAVSTIFMLVAAFEIFIIIGPAIKSMIAEAQRQNQM